MSLNVNENATIRKLRYGFLFSFHINYGPVLYHFRYILVENHDFLHPLHLTVQSGEARRNTAITFGVGKLEWCSYPNVKKV